MNKSASGFIIKVHVREQGGHIFIIINHAELVAVGLVHVCEDVEAEGRDLMVVGRDLMVVDGPAACVLLERDCLGLHVEELGVDAAEVEAPAPVLAQVGEILEFDVQLFS